MPLPFVPAEAGTQLLSYPIQDWVPACVGTNGENRLERHYALPGRQT
jgi:hypothetical protein